MDERRNVIIAIAGHNLLRSIIERLKHEESSDDEYDRWNQEANVFETSTGTSCTSCTSKFPSELNIGRSLLITA